MMMMLSAGHLCHHWHLPVLLQTPPLMRMTCCGLRNVTTSQNIMAHGHLGCMHKIWHGHLPICRGPGVMLRYTFIKFSLMLHGQGDLLPTQRCLFWINVLQNREVAVIALIGRWLMGQLEVNFDRLEEACHQG